MLWVVVWLTTWCWSADLNSHGSCVYSREQCYALMRLRGSGVCRSAQGFPRSQEWPQETADHDD